MREIWSNIKSFWYLGLVIFGTVGAMLGMGMGPTVTPRTISLLLEIACALLALIAVFLHFSQNYANKREREVEILKKALLESQEKVDGLHLGFQKALSSLNKEMRTWEKKFEELNLPPPTQDDIWRATQNFETPPPAKINMWEKVKALPLLLKKPS